MKRFFLAALILFFVTSCFAGRTDTVLVYSPSMKKEIKCVVITPDNHWKKRNSFRFPVVIILHGHGGSYAQWPRTAPQLADLADRYQSIYVCPDGGVNSWYLDSPIDTTYKYETFVSGELISFIDQKYKTIADRSSRAITGLSMGGHGGMYLAIRHQNVFGSAGSTSGGVDFRPFPNNWGLKTKLGDTSCCIENWNRNVVINLVDTLTNKALNIIIDCGIDDFFLPVNRALHEKLLKLNIDHDYTERPGAHKMDYWKNSINYQLEYFYLKMGREMQKS